MAPMTPGRFNVRALLPLLGGLLIFLAERLWPGHPVRPYLSAAGALVLLAGWGWALAGALRAGPLRRFWRWSALVQAPLLLAAAVYFAGLLLPQGAEGAFWRLAAGWAWGLALVIGAFAHGFFELGLWLQASELTPEPDRVARATTTGLALGLLLASVAALYAALHQLPWQWDLSTIKLARPGTATRQVTETLLEPVEVALFFPAGNGVLPLVRDYFIELTGSAGLTTDKLKASIHDADLEPTFAKTFRVRANGDVVLRKGDVVKAIGVGLDPVQSQPRLLQFDEQFAAALVEVSRPRKTLYFTVGHGERYERGENRPAEARISQFEQLLLQRNFTVKPLGYREGLGTEIPQDAAAVVVTGPSEPFLAAEAAALRTYLAAGGRLLVFLEPEPAGGRAPRRPSPLNALLGEYGLEYDATPLANNRFFGRRTFTPADHGLLVTVQYRAHPAVAMLQPHASQFPYLLLGSGAWRVGKVPQEVTVQQLIVAMPGTWADANGNFRPDPPAEKPGEPFLAMAVAPREVAPPAPAKAGAPPPPKAPTILAFADVDVVSDLLLPNRSNQLVLTEGLRWLLGAEQPAIAPRTEADLLIRHVKGDELVWFYLPVFGVPLLALACGLLLTARHRLTRWGGRHD
ncbi:MAG: Gldg family protein [Candidatus Lambdaproteobacteria bacterium]|nr:Gldg family protein [Candidatus Lambdaproteobacteria bacterium]